MIFAMQPETPLPPLVLRLLLGLSLALIAWPVWRGIDAPYPHSLQGEIQAWSATMAENLEEHGFRDARFMPHLDLHPEVRHPAHRWYPTHPVLDVVIRAVLVRHLGPSEATMRYQGLAGVLMAALALFFLVRRRMGEGLALVAATAMAAAPLWADIAHLSLHHPLSLGFGLWAMAVDEGRTKDSGRGRAIIVFLLLALAMQIDWPGYFFAGSIWLRHLMGGAGPRRASTLLGLPLLAVVSVAALWVHTDYVAGAPGIFLDRVRNASADSPTAGFFSAEGLRLVLDHQVRGFGWYGLALVLAAFFVTIGDGRRPERRGLWMRLFVLGALNYLVFPAKGPAHDFWGAYWLPLVGLSWGIAIEVLGTQLERAGLRAARPALILTALLGLIALAFLREPRDEYAPTGRDHATLARTVLASVPPEDRGFFVSTAAGYNDKLMTAYLRVQVVSLPLADVATMKALPQLAKKSLYHLEGKPCLVFVPGPQSEGDAPRREALVAFLRRVGKPYDHDVATYMFDVTDWVWSDDD